ncbi:MAG: Rieske 2Fe-2S domain-containing protein [Melioribacteraceae bacterium]|nr:Rieske 2Fe-2S domain-containing protein [Melioribacteraceae bacterium]
MSEVLKNNWYLVCPSSDLENKMRTFKILGEEIILFRDKEGNPIALEDRCCHRNVNLSLGYLKNDRPVCGYHGWEYDKSGQCVLIPSQLPDNKIPPKAVIKKYAAKDYNNWVWLFAGNPDEAENYSPTDIPEMKDWPFTYKEYIFEADLESTAESLIDPYHIAFTHRDSIKQLLGQIEEFPAEFHIDFLEDGIKGSYKRSNKGNIGEKIYFGSHDHHDVNYRFYFPNISRLETRFNKRVLLILEHVYQVDDSHVSMTQITLWQNIFPKFPLFAKKFMAKKSDTIVKEDIQFLVSQKKHYNKMKDEIHEVSVKGDEVSLAFRKFWRSKLRGE